MINRKLARECSASASLTLHAAIAHVVRLLLVHYAASPHRGPTGTRAEHITEMLSVPGQVHANKIHAALPYSARSLQVRFRCRPVARAHAALLAAQVECKPRPIKMDELLRSTYANGL